MEGISSEADLPIEEGEAKKKPKLSSADDDEQEEVEMFEGKPITTKLILKGGQKADGTVPSDRNDPLASSVAFMVELEQWVTRVVADNEHDDDMLTNKFISLIPGKTENPAVHATDSAVSPLFSFNTAVELLAKYWLRYRVIVAEMCAKPFVRFMSTRCCCLRERHHDGNKQCMFNFRKCETMPKIVLNDEYEIVDCKM
jgi:hypothetical protein